MGVAINDLVETRIEGRVLTLEAKDQVGMTPAAIGVKDEFGLCEIYIPFEIQVLGEGVTSNSCPELIGDIPTIALDETNSEVVLISITYFKTQTEINFPTRRIYFQMIMSISI